MRVRQLLAGRRVYLDANFFIYVVELYPPMETVLREIVRMLDAGDATGVTSAITLAEVLPGPRRAGNQAVEARFREMISDASGLLVAPVSDAVISASADIRVDLNVRLIDAIHIATARANSCDYLLTNDKSLAALKEPPVLLIEALQI